MSAVAALRRRPAKIGVDVLLLAGFVVELISRERSFDPEYVLHGTAGLVLIGILAVHLIGNWGWIARVARRRWRDREARLAALNLVFGVLTAVCLVSGIPLWAGWTGGGVLAGVHAGTGGFALLLMVVHLAWNQRRIRALVRPRRSRGGGPSDRVPASPRRAARTSGAV